VVARTGRVLNLDPWLTALDELREGLVTKPILFVWWTYFALRAPVWAWPLLLFAALPLLSWRMSAAVRDGTGGERLYVDETPSESNKDAWEQAQEGMKAVAKVQVTIANLAESLSELCSKVEKVKYVVVVGDTFTSLICGVIALACVAGLSAALWLAAVLHEAGCWYYVVWLTGCLALLPGALRQALTDLTLKTKAAIDGMSSNAQDEWERRLICFWRRIPDGIEACHLDLCRRYVLPGLKVA